MRKILKGNYTIFQRETIVEEKAEINKAFVQKSPELLIKVPENQELFTKSELDELLPLAKRALQQSED